MMGGHFFAELAALDCKPSTIQFRIDGIMYTSTKLPAGIGLELAPRVVLLLGSGLTRAIATGEMGDVDMVSAVLAVAERALRDGLVPTVRDLLQCMRASPLRTAGGQNGGPVVPVFDEHFAGEYMHLLRVCAFAIAHNLRGFTLGAH